MKADSSAHRGPSPSLQSPLYGTWGWDQMREGIMTSGAGGLPESSWPTFSSSRSPARQRGRLATPGEAVSCDTITAPRSPVDSQSRRLP